MSDISLVTTPAVRSASYHWALTGIFAAMHLIISFIPFTVPVGAEGQITFGLVSAPTIGFLLGPFFGTIAVLIGSTIAILVDPLVGVLGFFTPLATAAGALAAGSIRKGKPEIVLIIYVPAMYLFILGPVGSQAFGYLWFNIVTLVMLLLFMTPRVSSHLMEGLGFKLSRPAVDAFAVWLLSLCSVMADQIVGTTIASYYFPALGILDADSLAWVLNNLLIFVYPLERLVGSFIVAFLVFALGKTLAKSYFNFPVLPGLSDE